MKKTFDCVAMKDNIQQRLLKQMEGLSYEQRRVAIQSALESSRSPIGEFWRALERRESMRAGRVAETGEIYRANVGRDHNPDQVVSPEGGTTNGGKRNGVRHI